MKKLALLVPAHGRTPFLITFTLICQIGQVSAAEREPNPLIQEIEEVVVTASRIDRVDFSYSNPVVSIMAETIESSGSAVIVDVLKQFPALSGSRDHQDASGVYLPDGTAGGSGLDLRNLGLLRTLTLVNGRRTVGVAFPDGTVNDIESLPVGLINRVEVMTGGASALYGADGVSGVVNFIMENRFEGLDLSVQSGSSDQQDAETSRADLTWGRSVAGGRGHFSAAIGTMKYAGLKGKERDFTSQGLITFVQNPNDPDDDPAIPDLIPLRDIRLHEFSGDGAVDTDFDFFRDHSGNDSPWDSGAILPFIQPFFQQGGDGAPLSDYVVDLLPKKEGYSATALFDFELSPQTTFFSELHYSRNESYTEGEGSYDFFLYVDPTNPFVPPNIGSAADGGPILITRSHFDLGLRAHDNEVELLRGLIGFRGEINPTLDYEISYSSGKSKVDANNLNNRYNDRFAAGLDVITDPVSGEAICRSELEPEFLPLNMIYQGWEQYEPLPGTWAGSFMPGSGDCVPVNLFGDGSVSAEAAAWINTNSLAVSKMDLDVLQAYVSGDSSDWFSLPSGPVGFVLGTEWRKEVMSSTPAEESQAGLTFFNKYDGVRGSVDVKEVFVEFDVPLIMDTRFAEVLAFDTALRYSDYSTIGNTKTWKAGLVWQPVTDLTFRGTLARAVRAPSVPDLFGPLGQSFADIPDPCDINNVANGSTERATNCAILLNSLDVDQATYLDPNSASVSGFVGGNSGLTEETADTLTWGLIYTPGFIEGLTINLDWYDIELADAINFTNPQDLAELCVDLPGFGKQYCDLIPRETGTGRINSFTAQIQNVTAFNTSGVDFSARYLLDPQSLGLSEGFGSATLQLSGTKLDELTTQSIPGAPFESIKGMRYRPEWQANFDMRWLSASTNLTLNWRIHYFDETFRFDENTRRNNPDIVAKHYFTYDRKLTQDIFSKFRINENFELFGGINNLTNQQPDLGDWKAVSYPVSAVGRNYFLGLNFSL